MSKSKKILSLNITLTDNAKLDIKTLIEDGYESEMAALLASMLDGTLQALIFQIMYNASLDNVIKQEQIKLIQQNYISLSKKILQKALAQTKMHEPVVKPGEVFGRELMKYRKKSGKS